MAWRAGWCYNVEAENVSASGKPGERLTVGEGFQTIGFLIWAFLILDNMY